MKLLVFSDSHRSARNITGVLERLHSAVSIVIHLGDCVEDMEYFDMLYPDITFYSVTGNCDYGSVKLDEQIFRVNRRAVMITHGHTYMVKYGYKRIMFAAADKEADICLFGHTHEPIIFTEGRTTFMNPGSIASPRGRHPASYGMIDINDNGLIRAEVVGKSGGHYVPLEVGI